jgi:excisionase family DNA binding protein
MTECAFWRPARIPASTGTPRRHGGRNARHQRLAGAMSDLSIDTHRRSFFTPDSLASYLRVSDRMIRKWVAEGRLRSYKLDGCRRFDPADVDSFVAQFQDERQAAVV